MENDALLDIQKQLGRIEATIEAVKDDVSELKNNAASQSEALEKAYEKAKARQDSIRDDLQHQIDGNKKSLELLDKRIQTLETAKERNLVKWWDKVLDSVVWLAIIAVIAVIMKWLNAPAEIVNQLP